MTHGREDAGYIRYALGSIFAHLLIEGWSVDLARGKVVRVPPNWVMPASKLFLVRRDIP